MIRPAVVVCLALFSCSPAELPSEPAPVAQQKSALVTSFAAGSLIIPMDIASQNNGTLRAFGLLDRLLRANVTVHRVALTGKAAGAIDFSATVSQQETGVALGTVNYRAGPFVIAAADVTPPVVTLVNTYLASDVVTNVHVATAAFSADVQRTLVAAPRIAVLRDGNEAIAYGYLNAANILDSAGSVWSNTSPGSLTLAAAAGVTGGAFDSALISGGQPAFEQLTSMHYTVPAAPEVVREVRNWLSLGPTTHAHMQCDAIAAFENDVNGRFLTTLGVVDDGATPNPTRVRVADSLFSQFDGTFTADNGSVDSIGLAPLSILRANSSLLIDRDASPTNTRMVWLTGHIDGDTSKGKVSYLGGHDYSVLLPISTNAGTNGTRLFLNGLYETPALFSTAQPVLTVTKSAPLTTNATNFTFTLSYTNAGPGPVFSAVLTDVLPTGTTFVSATGGGTNAAGTVSWPLGALASGATGSVTVIVSAPEGTYANQATLSYRLGMTPKSRVSNTTSTIVDRTAPDTTLTSTPPAVTASTNGSFAFTGTEAGTFECSLDGAAFATCTTPQALTGLADGSHTFLVRARDAALNVDATPASFTWTVDTVAPNTTLTTTPTAQSSSASASFTFSSTEAGTFECSVDGGAFSPCTSPAAFSGLSEGSHTFQVRARDTVGNLDATPASFTWTVDTTAPQTTITGGPAAQTNSTNASVTFTSSEAGTFQCSLDGAAFITCTSPFTATGLAEGSHTVLVRAIDASGNVDATPASRTWVVDVTAPSTTITTAPPALSSSTSATFGFTSGEFGATFQCSLDGAAFTACGSALTLSGLAQGSHTLMVQAVDAAGNVDASPASHTWSVDTIEPDTTLVSGPSGQVSSTSATFVVTSEATATFECALDGAAFTACNAMSSYSGLSEGSHTVVIRAVDATGNVDSTEVSRTWTVDTIVPDTTIATGPSGVVSSSTAAFTFTSSEAQVTFECALDGAAFTACNASTPLTGLGEGSHTLAVRAIDAAFNADATPASRTWTVDTLAPDTTLTGAPSGTTNVSAASLSFSSNEAGVTFECSLDGAPFASCTSPLSLTGLLDGAHTFTVRAIDAAGNVDSTPATASWTVDAAVPDTSLTAGPSGTVSSADAAFTFTSTKANSTFECSLDGAAFTACTTPRSFTLLADGSHTFSVRAIDPVGNVDLSPATRTWTIDTQAPDTTITVRPVALTNSTSGRFEFTSPQSGATFECSLDGAAWTVCTSPLVTPGRLADGVHVMLVRAIDAAGNFDVTPASATWQVDTVAPPAPAITEPVADATTGALPRFGGRAEAGSTVTVTINGMTVCTAAVSANGQWSCIATTALTMGAQTATATATDGAGNTSVPSLPRAFTVDTSLPDTVILTGPPALTRVAQADFTLSSDVSGATFECSLDGAAFTACTPASSFTVTDGAHVLSARAVSNGAVDASPATRAWALDTAAPPAPVLTSPTTSSTTSATPTFTGTAEAGSTVVVSIDGQPVCTTITDAAGRFSCAGATALPAGAHTATAVATDPAGNASVPSTGVPFTVVVATLDTAIIAGPSGTVSSTSAGFAFTSTLVGASFECSLDGAAFVACSTPVTFSGLASGSHTLEVRAVDGANVDTTPATRTWIIDASAPVAPVVTTPVDQSTIRTRTPRYSGTAEPGSTVIVSVDDRQVCTAIADANGAWSCTSTLPLADGAHRVAAVAVDAAGNSSPQSTVTRFVVDVPAMNVAIVSPTTGTLTNDNTPNITGTATPGSTVSVFVDGMRVGTTAADASGNWSFTPSSPVRDGVHAITARAELDGLVSATSAAVQLTIDTRAPVVTLTVTQENSETLPEVTFSADESPVTSTCSIDGAAFAPCTSPLDVSLAGDGNHTVVVRATDAAGNTGEATRTYVVTAPIVTRPGIAVRGGGCGCASTDGLSGVLAAFALLLFAARRSRRAVGASAVVAVLAANTAAAQVAGFDLERLDLNPGATASLVSQTGDVMKKGAWRASLVVHYEHDPLVLYRTDTNARLGAIVGSRLTTHLVGAWAPLDWLEIGLQVPIVVFQGGDNLTAWNVAPVATPAIGTPWVNGRFAVLRETAGAPLDLAIQVGLGIPVGSAAAYTNATPLAFAPRIGAGKSVLNWLRLGGEVGFLVRGADAALEKTGTASAFTFALSATTKGTGLRGEVTLRSAVALDVPRAGADLLLGARHPLGKWLEIFALGGPGIGTLPGNPAFRLLLGLALQPPLEENPVQRCDDSVSAEVLRDACGTLDADGDGITNAVDACPRVVGVASMRGCPMPDSDGDGLTDDVDLCPKEKGTRARNGCPVKDQDGDGVEDEVDACVAEKGLVERKGCPIRDADLDGVADDVDACPAEAGPVERKGCPLKDQDADTVEDALDNCPTEKGPAENAGCPAKVRQLVIITKDKLVIQEKVFFATGKSQVLPRSFRLLDNVAQVLLAHPELDRVRIEGHTDSQGNAAKNVALSQTRAEAVKAQLVKRKVAAERLKAVGYGPDKPTAPNDTAAGREQNRRVEFNFEVK